MERQARVDAVVIPALSDPPFPACWSWEPVTLDVLDRTGLVAWHDDRCAMCGLSDDLVEDHDHETGTVRGWLCRGCNVREGTRDHDGWRRYRWRNPATITGVRVLYSRL